MWHEQFFAYQDSINLGTKSLGTTWSTKGIFQASTHPDMIQFSFTQEESITISTKSPSEWLPQVRLLRGGENIPLNRELSPSTH